MIPADVQTGEKIFFTLPLAKFFPAASARVRPSPPGGPSSYAMRRPPIQWAATRPVISCPSQGVLALLE